MDLAALVDRLATEDGPTAERELIAAGEPAVAPLIRVLCDESSPAPWHRVAAVLAAIGQPAFEPLVEALAAAPTDEVARRCGHAFGHLETPDKAIYLGALRHPSPLVRAEAAYALQRLKADAEPFLPALLELLDDPDADVRQRALWACGDVGWAAVPALRRIRRGAGRRRRAALTVLAAIGGWDALDETDQRTVARLIEVKAAGETPEPMHLCGAWYALPTTDQKAVLDAFGLGEERPVTMRLGESAWVRDRHGWTGAEHAGCARMYVTPGLDGWTLAFGTAPAVAHIDDDEGVVRAAVLRHCAELSSRFGAAHWYGASCGDSWTAWCVAEAGTVVRFYDVFEPDDQIGDGHPAEDGYLLPHVDPFPDDAFDGLIIGGPDDQFAARYAQLKRELNIPDEAHATTVAARISVDPSALGPQVQVTGRGVLAVTACGAGRPGLPGALSI